MIKIYGHEEQLKTLEGYMEAAMSGLLPDERPGGIFLLMGHTGSGKTETVRYFAEHLHGDKKKMVKLNCAEYQQDHEIARLIGAPPGYIGYQRIPPVLTQKKINAASSRDCPWTIILFDEIEKASPALFDLLLGVMDKGELQTGGGTTLDFTRCFLFFTGNVGAEKYGRGIWKLEEKIGNFESEILSSIRGQFRPEFLGRVDKILLFNPLNEKELIEIIRKELREFSDRLSFRLRKINIEPPRLSVDEGIFAPILEKAESRKYGARAIKNIVVKEIIIPISYLLREGKQGGVLNIDKDFKIRWEEK